MMIVPVAAQNSKSSISRENSLLSVPKIRFCSNGDEVRRGRAQI